MKKIEVILMPDKFEAVKSMLEIEGYADIMTSEIQHHGKGISLTQMWRGTEYRVAQTKLKVEVFIPKNEDVKKIIKEITKIAAGSTLGDSKIFVYDIAEAHAVLSTEKEKISLN
jgi:nitrogen regulatory protein P-II 1